MLRSALILLLLTFIGVMPQAARAQGKAPRALDGWGDVVDPAGDCKISGSKDKLTIAVPGSKHDLSAEAGDMTAPRVLRDIEGDFIAQVKVSGNVRLGGRGLSQRYLPYHGAGLVVFVDGRNYIRLERAAIIQANGAGTHYANFEIRKDGKRANGSAVPTPDRDYYVRLERKGGRFVGAVSEEGVEWQPLEPITAQFPGKVKLGLVAINTSTDPFKAEFTDLEIYVKEKRPSKP